MIGPRGRWGGEGGGGARAGAIGSEVWTDDYHPFWRNHRRKWVGLRKNQQYGRSFFEFSRPVYEEWERECRRGAANGE